MRSSWRAVSTALLATGLLAACRRAPQPSPAPTQADLPNPAAVFCEEQGGRLEIRTDDSGGQRGFCLFAGGSECEEWAYFRGECQAGRGSEGETSPTAAPTAAPAEGWEIYTHPTLRYSFSYPSGSTLETDDIGRYVTVVGPLEENVHWPWFSVAHPDLEDYHPPADIDLQIWLSERNRLPGEVLGTRLIAGMPAIHTRNDNGPQAYDDDRFYFVHAGQVFEITITHAGREDWSIYDVFLDNFRF